jgi:hypothetical protein
VGRTAPRVVRPRGRRGRPRRRADVRDPVAAGEDTTSPKYWSVEIYPLGGPFTPGPGIVEAVDAGAYTGNTSRPVKLDPVGQV